MGSILSSIMQKQKTSRKNSKTNVASDPEIVDAWPVNDGPELKVIVVGSGGVGKSSLTLQFVHHYFPEEYDPTIEDSFRKQVVVDERCKLLEILDTAGQEEFRCMRDQWYRNGEAFFLVYSIVDRNSFDDINSHRNFILDVKDAKCGPMVLVGNKSDKEADRQVSTQEGKDLAAHLGIPFYEASAKNRVNVEEAFFELVRTSRKYERGAGSFKNKNNKSVAE